MVEKLNKVDSGNTAELFQVKNGKVLKLFKTGCSKELVMQEYQNHQVVGKVFANIPKLYELIEENGRFGYVMEQIQGANLTMLLLQELTFEMALELFVDSHKIWLKETSDEVVSYKDWMIGLLGNIQDKPELLEKIRQLPEGNTLCHGDFHPYNIIITTENKPIVIDFANVCCGPKEYDIARTYVLLEEAEAKQIAKTYLEKMQISFNEIQEYYEVIKQLRKYEHRKLYE